MEEGCLRIALPEINKQNKFLWKQVKVYWLARMGQNFDQAKRDYTFWPMPNILKGSVSMNLNTIKVIGIGKVRVASW